MKPIATFFLLALSIRLLPGQSITKPEAIEFAEKLFAEKILSEKGKNLLVQKIQQDLLVQKKRHPQLMNGSVSTKNHLSVSHILIFLCQAFGSDFYYRSGSLEYPRIFREYQDEKNGAPFTEEDYKVVLSRFEASKSSWEGAKIEAAIEDEDNLPELAREFILEPNPGIPSLKEYQLVHPGRSTMGKTCSRTLNDLLKIGLIDSTIHAEVMSLFRQNKLVLETILLAYTAKRAAYYEDYDENQAIENLFLKELHKKDILSDEGLSKITGLPREKKPENQFEYLNYCKNAKVFQLSAYPTDPGTAYFQIFNEIQSIIPGFQFTNFKFTISETYALWDSTDIRQDATISFEASGSQYFYTFFYDYILKTPFDTDQKPNHQLLTFSNDFHKGINKWLADQNSDYRLYCAQKPGVLKPYDNPEFGLILLNREQVRAWANQTSFILHPELHDNTFNTTGIAKMVRKFQKIGLFDHLSDEQKNMGLGCIKTSLIEDAASILMCFPKIIVYFDWESSDLEHPYQELTMAFRDASRGFFAPERIQDRLGEDMEAGLETTSFSFEFKGKKYETSIEIASDWLDPNFVELINKAIENGATGGKFYNCLNSGQSSGYIYLTPKQYTDLAKQYPALFSGE